MKLYSDDYAGLCNLCLMAPDSGAGVSSRGLVIAVPSYASNGPQWLHFSFPWFYRYQVAQSSVLFHRPNARVNFSNHNNASEPRQFLQKHDKLGATMSSGFHPFGGRLSRRLHETVCCADHCALRGHACPTVGQRRKADSDVKQIVISPGRCIP